MARAIKKFTDEEYRYFLDKCEIPNELSREEMRTIVQECIDEATAFLQSSIVVKLNERNCFVIKPWAKDVDDTQVQLLVTRSGRIIHDLNMFKHTLRRL